MRAILFVGIGGGLGSILRYTISLFVGKHIPIVFPLGTLLVNISGCFLIGVFYSVFARHSNFNPDWRLFLITGICGGYTTFSTFSYDGFILLKQGSALSFILYALGSVVIGLLATIAGVALFK
ncbi:MAG TPA: fluoride efflux transporter CrcB [Puia sp.]|jgi:fluoride exporter|nr:fluoride efflux transporter CrcB [Puia sp.]